MNRVFCQQNRGFTLIELLITVAVIAVLAAIALPNFLEAQTRSKVSRTKADMRSVAVGLEAYAADNAKYPPNFDLKPLSTPVAYITNAGVPDLFAASNGSPYLGYLEARATSEEAFLAGFGVSGSDAQRAALREHRFFLFSNAPDKVDEALAYPQKTFNDVVAAPGADFGYYYDPTNGTVSRGDVMRSAKGIK